MNENNIEIVNSDHDNTIDEETEYTGEVINDFDNENDSSNSIKDDCAVGLMRQIEQAIDRWAEEYNMNNLPKKAVFQQALALMNSWNF